MVHGYLRTFEYRIALDKEYDYFEVIPELEQRFKKRFHLECDCLIALKFVQWETRFKNSKYFQNNSENPDSFYLKKLTQSPVTLTEEEEDMLNQIPEILKTKDVVLVDEGSWYDVSIFY